MDSQEFCCRVHSFPLPSTIGKNRCLHNFVASTWLLMTIPKFSKLHHFESLYTWCHIIFYHKTFFFRGNLENFMQSYIEYEKLFSNNICLFHLWACAFFFKLQVFSIVIFFLVYPIDFDIKKSSLSVRNTLTHIIIILKCLNWSICQLSWSLKV